MGSTNRLRCCGSPTSQRQPARMLDLVQAEMRVDRNDAGQVQQRLLEEPLILLGVGADDLHEIVMVAGDQVAIEYLRLALDRRFEVEQCLLVMLAQAHLGKHDDAEAQRLAIELETLAANDSGILELLQPAPAGRMA